MAERQAKILLLTLRRIYGTPAPELDMIDWIHPWIGLDWIGLGQDFEETLWIGLGPITAIFCFFIYIFSILTTDKS